jgi:dTDP-4-dehydrorhamnose reductase
MVFSLLTDGMPQLVHLTSGGKDSWLGWARTIAEILHVDAGRLSPVSSEEYDPSVPRPAYSVLGTRSPSVSAMVSMHPATIGLKEYLGWLERSGAFAGPDGGAQHGC